jgi:hypothetical protein
VYRNPARTVPKCEPNSTETWVELYRNPRRTVHFRYTSDALKSLNCKDLRAIPKSDYIPNLNLIVGRTEERAERNAKREGMALSWRQRGGWTAPAVAACFVMQSTQSTLRW